MSFPVFWRYSLIAASKTTWKCENDRFGLELEEDIETVE
jgi:hypothetical protein